MILSFAYLSTKLTPYLAFTMYTNKSSLYYLYFKLKLSYKNLKNRRRNIKFLDLFKLQSKTIIAHAVFITHCNIKPKQYNQIYYIKNSEKSNVKTVILIINKSLILHKICTPVRMLKLKSLIKTIL